MELFKKRFGERLDAEEKRLESTFSIDLPQF